MSMRVQSGTARGRSIRALPTGPEVRPILARIRKSLFDILRPRLAGARFLDLFAGTGTVGIEALSNGAAEAVFVDDSPASCRLIEKNLDLLGFSARGRVVRADAISEVGRAGPGPFDLVFMGPPYKDKDRAPLALTIPALKALGESGLLGEGARVVGQHHKKEKTDPLPDGWQRTRQNFYGDSVLSFFQRVSNNGAPAVTERQS